MPFTTRTTKFLFFDNRSLEYLRGFTRGLNQPIKYSGNPVLEPEHPWEFNRTMLYGSVIREPEAGLFRMWYTTSTREPEKIDYLLYAESDDGYHWEKPSLDIVAGTNILLDREHHTHGPTVIRDELEEDLSRRYKLIMRPGAVPEIFGYVSSDGIHWRKIKADAILPYNSDCHIGLYRDSRTGLYQISFRADCPDRRVWRSESSDFLSWSRPALVLESDIGDPVQTQIYGMQMTAYGAYILGWMHRYTTREEDRGPGKMHGNWDIEFAWSRDGYCWHRPFQGQDFLPRGEKGSWDSQLISPASSPVFLENELRFYYGACANQHGDAYESKRFCVGAASLPPDRFIALEAGDAGGELMSRQFTTSAGKVFVNTAASRGQLRIAILDREGRPLPNFGLEDCIPIHEDGICLPVRWKASPDTNTLLGKPIRLLVQATNAAVYAVTFAENEGDAGEYASFREIKCLDPKKDLE